MIILSIFVYYYANQRNIKKIYYIMTLGERIKIVRIQKKISQANLAKNAGVHQKNISKYENGGVVPSAITLKSIANALGVTTDYLVGNVQEDIIKDTIILKYFKEVDKMPDSLKSALLTIIESCIRDYKTRQAYAS